MFIFLLALGEDYNILVIDQDQGGNAALPLAQAVVHAIGRTGPAGDLGRHGCPLAVLAFEAGNGPGASQW